MHEPLTAITDYLLTVASLVFAVLLWRGRARLWAAAFFFTATGSLFGGMFHAAGGGTMLWRLAVYSIGLASLLLLFAVTNNLVVRAFALALFIAYASWVTFHDNFLWVVIDYGVTLLVVAVLQIVAWTRERAAGAPWIIASVGVSIIAAIVQQAPTAYHNDIYHAIQLIALWLLYRGGAITSSATVRSTIRPT